MRGAWNHTTLPQLELRSTIRFMDNKLISDIEKYGIELREIGELSPVAKKALGGLIALEMGIVPQTIPAKKVIDATLNFVDELIEKKRELKGYVNEADSLIKGSNPIIAAATNVILDLRAELTRLRAENSGLKSNESSNYPAIVDPYIDELVTAADGCHDPSESNENLVKRDEVTQKKFQLRRLFGLQGDIIRELRIERDAAVEALKALKEDLKLVRDAYQSTGDSEGKAEA